MQVFSTSTHAIQLAQTRLNASGERLAQPVTEAKIQSGQTPDYAKERVGQMMDENDVKAQVSTIRTQDRMLGEILDLKA
jgi:hypothetical protein